MTTEDSLQPIELKTVTPIWTGGVDRSVDRVHATGIMGSLRWWYEVLVRGIGGYSAACDLGEHKCLYDKDKPEDGLCHACRVFGATGWSRRFHLIVDDKTDPIWSWPKKIEGKPYIDQNGKKRIPTWYFNDPPRGGSLSMRVISTGPLYERDADNLAHNEFFKPEVIYGLVEFMEEWGSIGARPQMGFGLFEITSQKKGYLQLLEHLQKLSRINASISTSTLPTLRTIFFTRIKVGSAEVKETFYLKSDLRRQFCYDKDLRHFVMGTIKDGHQRAKIMMSHPTPDGTIRIWGWIPETIEVGEPTKKFTGDAVIQKVHAYLGSSIIYWREFNSPRDKHKYSEPLQFLESLTRGEK